MKQFRISVPAASDTAAAGQARRDRAGRVRSAVVSLWLPMRVVASGSALRRSGLGVFPPASVVQSTQHSGIWDRGCEFICVKKSEDSDFLPRGPSDGLNKGFSCGQAQTQLPL